MSSKRKFFNLKLKIEAIELSKKGESARKLAAAYGCDTAQIIDILKSSGD